MSKRTTPVSPAPVKESDQVVQRLRALLVEEKVSSNSAGHNAGAEWAQSKAKPRQLKRLVAARDPQCDWYFGDESVKSAYTDAENFHAIIEGISDSPDRDAASKFWEEAVGDGVEIDGDFVAGFAEAAAGVWGSFKDKV